MHYAIRLLLLSFWLSLTAGFLVAPSSIQRPLSTPTSRPPITTLYNVENLEDMDREALLEYLNSDGLGLSFQEYQKREQQKRYLENCPLFRDLSVADCDRIASSLEELQIEKGTVLIQEGDLQGDAMYFLVQGQLVATSNNTLLTTYQTPGDFFGELALMFKEARAATITASKDSKVYKLNKDAFSKSLQDSPVFETARKMLLKKYSSTRLRDVLPKISINEYLDLLTAKLQSKASNTIVDTLFPFSLGASFMVLASIWKGQIAKKGWPFVLFDWKALSSTKLPIALVSVLLTASAVFGNASITNDQKPTNQSFKRRLHRLSVWAMIALCFHYRRMALFFPVQLMLAIGVDATKDSFTSSFSGDSSHSEQPNTQPSNFKIPPAVVLNAVLGYEVLRNFVGA